MIHVCQIHCLSMDFDKAELMGIKDQGKWLPFAFLLEIVIGCKMTTDDLSEITAGCTTIFTESGDTYIIDTPYDTFLSILRNHYDLDPVKTNKPEL